MILLPVKLPSRQSRQILLQVDIIPAVPVFYKFFLKSQLPETLQGGLVNAVELEAAAVILLQITDEPRQVFLLPPEGLKEKGCVFHIDFNDEEAQMLRPIRTIVVAPNEQVRIGALGPHVVRFVQICLKQGTIFHGHIFKF